MIIASLYIGVYCFPVLVCSDKMLKRTVTYTESHFVILLTTDYILS